MPISRIKTDGIADDAITSPKIGVDVIVADDLAANSVTVSEITNGAVTSAKLDTNIAVTGTLSAGGALTSTGEFKANGGVVFNEDSLDVDFRVESNNNANMLVVDAGNDTVGIGESNPQKALHITRNDSDGMIVFDANGVTTDHQICFSKNYGTGGTAGGNYWGIGVDGSENKLVFAYDPNSQASLLVDAKMVLDSNGKVGIGTPDPAYKLAVEDGTGATRINVRNTANAAAGSGIYFEVLNGASIVGNGTVTTQSSGDMVIFTGTSSGAERLRIGAVGLVTFNGDKNGVSDAQVNIVNDEANGLYRCLNLYTGVTGQRIMETFFNGNGQVGYIATNGSSTSYVTSSDYRLKENVTSDWEATTRLKQLNPVRFNFIADADTTVDGFLAHEVQSIVPEAITGTHNEVDDEGNPVYQGIDQGKLVPLLVKTIQELEARITALESR